MNLAEYDALFIAQTTQLILAKDSAELIKVIREQTGHEYESDVIYAAAFGALSERTRVLIHRLAAAEARVAELEAELATEQAGHAADQETLSAIEQAGQIPWPVPADA